MAQNSEKPVTSDYFLKPGFIYLPDRPATISTVLGSSVAVSLYDRSRKIGGMNHFLFPYIESRDKTTAQYGNIAVLTLIRMIAANGSDYVNLEAQIFGGKFTVDDFEPRPEWDGPYYGMDFGFAQDPTAAVQCYIWEGVLYIRREAGKAKLELDATAAHFTEQMPGIERHAIRADSARPESISYLRNDLPTYF